MKKLIIVLFAILLLLSISFVSAAAVVNSGGLSPTASAGTYRARHLSLNGGTKGGWEIGLGPGVGTYNPYPTGFVNTDFTYGPLKWLASNHIKLVYDASTNMMTSTTNSNGISTLQYPAISLSGKNYFQIQVSARTAGVDVHFNNVYLTTPSWSGSLGNFDSGINAQTFWNVLGINLDQGFTLEGDIVPSGLTNDGGDESNKVNIDFGNYVPPCTPTPNSCDGIDNDCMNGADDPAELMLSQSCGTGACVGTQTRICINAGQPGAYYSAWGACSTNGKVCEDGLYCSVNDKCNANGECASGQQKICLNDNNPCTDDYCNEGTDSCTTYNNYQETCYDGSQSDMTVPPAICRKGTKTCSNGILGQCIGEILPATEIIGNEFDENCDGVVVCDSSAEWKSHGDYVSCVAAARKSLGLIPSKDNTVIQKTAAQSLTGKAISDLAPETTWLGLISIISIIALVVVSLSAFNKIKK